MHVQLSLRDLKNLWDSTLEFLQAVEGMSGTTGYGLRSCLLQQAKAFLEHKHEAQLAALVATLDSEKWAHAHVSAERQSALDRLATGRAFMPEELSRSIDTHDAVGVSLGAAPSVAGTDCTAAKKNDAVVDGTAFKVVWSVLLLVEMVMANLSTAAHFPALATDVLGASLRERG